MSTNARTYHEVTIADVTITWIPPEERSHPADAYRLQQDGGRRWLLTEQELDTFEQQLSWLKRDEEATR